MSLDLFLTTLKKLTLSIVNKFPLRSLNRFFLPSFRDLSACGGIFSAPKSRKKRHKDKLCVKNTLFLGKGRLFTVTRPQAEFDDCLRGG